tara:strand:+ start:1193 stop:1549 length:357 start_codon:yes stop_codon:yes gene_type:complete
MTEEVIYYLLGSIIVSNLIIVWKFTNISIHFLNFFLFFKKNKPEIYTTEELEDYLILHGGLIGELLVCPLCLSTHLSWIVSLVIFLLTSCSPLIIPCAMFSWPLVSFIIYGLVKKIFV